MIPIADSKIRKEELVAALEFKKQQTISMQQADKASLEEIVARNPTWRISYKEQVDHPYGEGEAAREADDILQRPVEAQRIMEEYRQELERR